MKINLNYLVINKLVLILLIMAINGCLVRFDTLEYYTSEYSVNNDDFSTNGVYYKNIDGNANWPNSVEYLTFFKDGSFTFGSEVENLDTLNSYICRYPEQLNIYSGGSGIYTIKNDTIFTEFLLAEPKIFNYAKRNYFKSIQIDKGIKITEFNGKKFNEIWSFNKNDCMPDSAKNIIMTHRKYKFK